MALWLRWVLLNIAIYTHAALSPYSFCFYASRKNVLKDENGNYLQEKVKRLDEDTLAEDLEEMGAEAGSRAPQDLASKAIESATSS